MFDRNHSKALLTEEQARKRFEDGLPLIVMLFMAKWPNPCSHVMMKLVGDPDFDYQLRVFKNQSDTTDIGFFALRRDKDGPILFKNNHYDEQPVDPKTGEDLVRLVVSRREIYVQDVEVLLSKSSATIEDAIEIVEDGGGEEVRDSLTYSDTCGRQYWTVQGPTDELTREFPAESLDVD